MNVKDGPPERRISVCLPVRPTPTPVAREQGGYSYGEVKIEGMGPDSGSEMCVRLQNENYYAYISTDGAEEPVCVSPDLITLVDQVCFGG